MERLSEHYTDNVAWFNETLGVGRSVDIVSRDYLIGGRRARLWVIDGYGKDGTLERMGAFWLSLTAADMVGLADMQGFIDRFITFSETNISFDRNGIVTNVLLGKTLLLVEGLSGAALMDAKEYPARSVGEPPDGKVLRGSHDGFVEAVVPNMALLRRRIRDPHLTMEGHKVGLRSRTDTVLCYLDDKVNRELLEEIRHKLDTIDVNSLTMAQESVAEAIRPKQWYNPFPKVRYTERPDVATASVMEGSILVLVDNTPVVMVLPVSLLRFNEEINDYYFPPLVGTYLRVIRFFVMLLNVIITPLWYLLATEPGGLREPWDFLLVEGDYAVPLIGQLLLVELIIDVLKLASLNTPDVLGNSFSMLGALILGDFAVQSRWLVPEVLVYMAFVAVSNFAQHSFEMGYACKLCRMALVLLAFAFRWWGFGIGLVGVLVLIATTKPAVGRGYLYPLIPWNGKALRALLLRRPAGKNNT